MQQAGEPEMPTLLTALVAHTDAGKRSELSDALRRLDVEPLVRSDAGADLVALVQRGEAAALFIETALWNEGVSHAVSTPETDDRMTVVTVGPEPTDPALAVFDTVQDTADDGAVAAAVRRVARFHAMQRENQLLRSRLRSLHGVEALIGRSGAMARVRDAVGRAARDGRSLWLYGPAGSGRAHVARAVHEGSGGDDASFLRVDAATLAQRIDDPFTGGLQSPGLFQQAAGGTLYIERIEQLDRNLQASLERALLGDEAASVRVVVAADAPPREVLGSGRLAESLIRLLSVETVELLPLSDRTEDLPLLARGFLNEIAVLNALDELGLDDDALACLERYSWPGNIGELRQALEHAALLADDGTIHAAALPEAIRGLEELGEQGEFRVFRDAKKDVVSRFERSYLAALLRRHNGNVTSAAQEAGMLRSALQRLLRKYELRSATFRKARSSATDRQPDDVG